MTPTNYPATITLGVGALSYALPVAPLIEPYLVAHVHPTMRDGVRAALLAKLTSEETVHPSQSRLKYLETRVTQGERENLFLRAVIAHLVATLDAMDFDSSALEWKAVKQEEYAYDTEFTMTWYDEQKRLAAL